MGMQRKELKFIQIRLSDLSKQSVLAVVLGSTARLYFVV